MTSARTRPLIHALALAWAPLCVWVAFSCSGTSRISDAGGVGAGSGGSQPAAAGSGGAAGGSTGRTEDASPPSSGAPDAGPLGADGGTPAPPVSQGALFPAAGAPDVCPDPPLRMHFSEPPVLGNSGKIQVFDVAAPDAPVAVVDFAVTALDQMIGGASFKLPRPVYVDGADVIVRLPAHALKYGRSYYVIVAAGAIKERDGTPFSITSSTAWRFSTLNAAPAELSSLHVAIDGTGQFCSIQGALDALPARNSAATVIDIAPGRYFEVVRVTGKSSFTLRGADRKTTIVTGVNNNTLNPNTATRALVGIDDGHDIVIESLTIHNLTPQGGSQAEALRLQSCDRCVVRHADLLSLQDTLLWSGRIYAQDCYVEGNVDFVWGTGAAFFDRCEIKTVGRAGYVVQARNGASGAGYVFVDSKITAGTGVTGISLGRADVSQYPASQVAYVDCQMGSHILPAGWTITGGAASPSLNFWEYHSTDATGALLDVSRRIAGSTQISQAQANMLREPANVLGGWAPPK